MGVLDRSACAWFVKKYPQDCQHIIVSTEDQGKCQMINRIPDDKSERGTGKVKNEKSSCQHQVNGFVSEKWRFPQNRKTGTDKLDRSDQKRQEHSRMQTKEIRDKRC